MNKLKQKNTKKIYNLPEEVIFCKKCTISNQRPRISFDEKGVCSACNFSDYKKNKINWKVREQELANLCDKNRKSNGDYDILVPCSGGKDGSYVAHQLKYKYGMNPLTVTWAPLKATKIGRKNLDNFIASGFDHIMGTPNPIITRKLTKLAFQEMGDPFQPFIYGQYNFPLHMALKYNIKIVMYGENGEVEYGGDMKNAYIPTREFNDANKHYFSNISPERWTKYNIEYKDLKTFLPPSYASIVKNNIEIHFYSYYKYWDPQENYYYSKSNTGFTPNDERTEGTYSKYASIDDQIDGFHYYLSFIKFGIGRATADSAHEVRDEKITREEGILLVKKFDGEFPKKYFNIFLDYCDLEEGTVHEILDSWRSPHIWKKMKNKWVLKKPIWQEDN